MAIKGFCKIDNIFFCQVDKNFSKFDRFVGHDVMYLYPSTWEAETGELSKYKVNLDHIVRLCFKDEI